MIKWPEPVELNPAANSVMGHSDATLKQAVRDALEEAAKVAEIQMMGAKKKLEDAKWKVQLASKELTCLQ